MTTQAQFGTTAPQPVVIQTGQPQVLVQPFSTQAPNRRDQRKHVLFGLGITEVILGSFSILFAVIAMAIGHGEASKFYNSRYNSYYYTYNRYAYILLTWTYSSQGIWGGFLILITGVLGIRAKSNPTKCLFIANITMATLTANVASAAFILSVVAALSSHFSSAMVGLHSMISLFTFVSIILTIIHASFGCCGICCGNSTQKVVTIPQNAYPAQPVQYVQGPNGQFIMAGNQAFLAMNAPQPMQLYPQSSTPAYSLQGQKQNMETPSTYIQPGGQNLQV